MTSKGFLRYFNRQLLLSCLLIAVSTFNYGFDNQAFSTTEAMTAFVKKFGVYNATKKTYALETYWLSLFNSLNYIGFAVGKSWTPSHIKFRLTYEGVTIGSAVSARFGRRMCMFTMSCWALVSATIAVTSANRNQLLAARILNCRLHQLTLIICTADYTRCLRRDGALSYPSLPVRNCTYTCSRACSRYLPIQPDCKSFSSVQ